MDDDPPAAVPGPVGAFEHPQKMAGQDVIRDRSTSNKCGGCFRTRDVVLLRGGGPLASLAGTIDL